MTLYEMFIKFYSFGGQISFPCYIASLFWVVGFLCLFIYFFAPETRTCSQIIHWASLVSTKLMFTQHFLYALMSAESTWEVGMENKLGF